MVGLVKKSKSILSIDQFLGIDYTNDETNVAPKMSPYAPNMIRDVPGKVRKSMGWYKEKHYDGTIYGSYARRGDTERLIHAGNKIYRGDTQLYSGANTAPSRAFQFGDKLVIVDGKKLLIYDGTEVVTAESIAYIPTLYIAEAPNGGGEEYEGLNLLQPKWYELYQGTATDKTYQLAFGGLDTDFTPQAWILNASGEWVETTAFTVNYTDGKITFTTAPGVSPVTGEDNVKILAKRTVEGYADRINKCTVGIQFGVNANPDRLFLSGNPDLEYINFDWHSGQNDPTYFADTSYAEVGTHGSAVMGYALINNYLAAFKDDMEPDRNVVIREGDLVENEAAFPAVNTLQGAGCIAKNSIAYLGNEPLFLTKSGIIALTTSDISGEKYSHTRSWYINSALKEETGHANACAVVANDMYYLFINGKVWILDDLQWQYPTFASSSGTAKHSNRQLSCFNRLNVPAVTAWTDENNEICFGTEDGYVCRFYTDKDDQLSYCDGAVKTETGFDYTNAQSIYCCWETPDLSGRYFYKNKTFKYLAIRVAPEPYTSLIVYAMRNGLWKLISDFEENTRYFNFAKFNFAKFTFATDAMARTLHKKIKIKKVDKARFRFENTEINEPFELLSFAAEYVENGNYKR